MKTKLLNRIANKLTRVENIAEAITLENEQLSRRPTVHIEPINSIEDTLAQIWCVALRLRRVGTEESFFELGGNSITAIRIISRVSEQYKINITIRDLFDNPTIRQLEKVMTVRMEQSSK